MTDRRTWGVLLAAGASRRMGTHKLLLDVGGEPLVRRSARALLACDLAGVLVVTGRDPDAVEAALGGLGCHFVHNPGYLQGELPSSIAAALRHLPAEAEGALLTLADMPFVQEAHLRRVLGAAEADDTRTGVAETRAALSQYGRVTAPPHRVPRTLFGAVLQATEAGLGRPLLAALGRVPVRVPQPAADLLDMDDEASYAAVQARLERLGVG